MTYYSSHNTRLQDFPPPRSNFHSSFDPTSDYTPQFDPSVPNTSNKNGELGSMEPTRFTHPSPSFKRLTPPLPPRPPVRSQASIYRNSPKSPSSYTEDDAEALFTSHTPLKTDCRPLPLPVVLPQVTNDFDAPFARAYADIEMSGVIKEDWIKIVDGLNIAMISSPPLQIVHAAGGILGLAPSAIAAVTGAGLQIGASLTMRSLSKGLADRYLQYVNRNFFLPRGLSLQICSTSAMRQLVHFDIPSPAFKAPNSYVSYGKSTAKTAEGMALHVPYLNRYVNRWGSSVPLIDPNCPLDATGRRLETLRGFVMEVCFDVALPETPEGMLNKASGRSVNRKLQKIAQNQQQNNRHRAKLAVSQGVADDDTFQVALSPPQRGTLSGFMHGVGIKAKDAMSSGTQDPAVVETKRQVRLHEKVAIASKIEHKATKDLLWIVLTNAGSDLLAQGALSPNTRSCTNISKSPCHSLREEKKEWPEDKGWYDSSRYES